MGLLGGLVTRVVDTTTALANALSSLIGSLVNALGSAGAAANGIAGYLISAVGGSVNAVFPFLGIVTAVIGAIIELTGTTPPSIPIPNPIVTVTTDSGAVHRVSYVPIGGLPVAIDVDDGKFAGVLKPDITVAVGLLGEQPTSPEELIQPSITIAREPGAAKSGAPAPPLKINTRIELRDAFNGFGEFATVNYGYDTPKGGRVPPLVKARLTGSITEGFIDPLKAVIDAPGYSAPLRFDINASTPTFGAGFGIKLDPLPRRLNIVEDPRDDGLDIHLDHAGAFPDVNVDANVVLSDKVAGTRRTIDATIDRLPQSIDVADTTSAAGMQIDYRSTRTIAKADIDATYRDFAADGTLGTEANVKVGALPDKMRAVVRTVPNGPGGADLDGVDFRVLDGDEIGSVGFLVKNFLGDPGLVPIDHLGPAQFVTFGQRRLTGGVQRYRAAGRVNGVRSVSFDRTGPGRAGYDIKTDLGNGVDPLRAIVDIDDRGPGAPGDAQRFKVDAKLSPLPRTIRTVYLPGGGADTPTKVTYDSPQAIDATAQVLLARGPLDACGQARVTCADAGIDRLPKHLELSLPGQGGSDYAVSHDTADVALRPDLRATVDNTPDSAADRVWAQVAVTGLPPQIRARIASTPKDVLRAAEFHGCAWDFAQAACTDTQNALGRVAFTVRDAPVRAATLPRRPSQAPTFVSLIRRAGAFEIQGRVDAIRNVAFRQRDDDNDGKPDGTLGVAVDAGVGGPFDAHVDQLAPDPDRADPKPDAQTILDAHVAALPTTFAACFRAPQESAPGTPSDSDGLLAPCDRRDVLGRSGSDLDATPLSLDYRATASTKVNASLTTRAVDDADKDPQGRAIARTRTVDVNVDAVPRTLRADVLLPRDSDTDASAARALEARYEADAPLATVDLTLHDRRADGTASPALDSYVQTRLTGVPSKVTAVVDTARKVLRRADFHACDWDFSTESCRDSQQELGSVEFLVRTERRRGALPAVPPHAADFVSVIRRSELSEISGRLGGLRNASFRQRDDNGDGEADGTLGIRLDAGSGNRFDAHVDQVAPDAVYADVHPQPTSSQLVDAHVVQLPTHFEACLRQPSTAGTPDPDGLSADPVLKPCDSDDVLTPRDGEPAATPLTVSYQAATPTGVTAHVRGTAKDPKDADRLRTSEATIHVDAVPATLRADVLTGNDVVEAGPGVEARAPVPLRALYTASAPIDALNVELENRRGDGTRSPTDSYVKADLTDIPSRVSAEVDSARGVLRRAEFRACPAACVGGVGSIGKLAFTVRPTRLRGELPAPRTGSGAYVSYVRRYDDSEASGVVRDIRNVVLRQRDADEDGKADGTIGVQVDAGAGGPFDAFVDQVGPDMDRPEPRPEAATKLVAHVAALPSAFSACFRAPSDGDPQHHDDDALLAPCEEREVLGDNLKATPLSISYAAAAPTRITADLTTRGVDLDDLNGETPIEHTRDVSVDVDAVPATLRADVLTPNDGKEHPRPLLARYAASANIERIDLKLHDRRSDGTRAPNGSYVEATLDDLPPVVSARIDTRRKVLRAADFHACDWSYDDRACVDTQRALGKVTFLSRDTRSRGALPAVPDHADTFVSILKRRNAAGVESSEATGSVSQIRNVAFRQRDGDLGHAADGKPDGTIGVAIQAGNGTQPFDVLVDQVARDDDYAGDDPKPNVTQVVRATVAKLPTSFQACVRAPSELTPPSAGDLDDFADPLLDDCDPRAVLGYDDGELPATPLSASYRASARTRVDADVSTTRADPDDGGRQKVTALKLAVDEIPTVMRADVLPGITDGSEQRPLRLAYDAASSIGKIGLDVERRRADGLADPDNDLFAQAQLRGVPGRLAGLVDTASDAATSRAVVRRAEFRACDFDFDDNACRGGSQAEIDNLSFLVRPRRLRGALPPQPQVAPGGGYVSVVGRGEETEVAGNVKHIRGVAFAQREKDKDGRDDPAVGVDVQVGDGGPFDVHVDQRGPDGRPELGALSTRPESSLLLDAHVAALPTSFQACLRSGHEGSPKPADDGGGVLSACDATDSGPQAADDEPAVTPMRLSYEASSALPLHVKVRKTGLDLQDRPHPDADVADDNRPVDHTTVLDSDVPAIPGRIRATVIPGLAPKDGARSRRLQVGYDADRTIPTATLRAESRRTTSQCRDPRQGRQSTCVRVTATDIPKSMSLSFDPDEARGGFELRSDPPAPGGSLMSLPAVQFRGTGPESDGHPIEAELAIKDIPSLIRGRFAQFDPDGSGPGKQEPGVVQLNACPQSGACPGIGEVVFRVTNSLNPAALPTVPDAPQPGINQYFTMTQRGDDFIATGRVNDVRHVAYSRFGENPDPDGAAITPANVSKTENLRAAFGNGPGDPLRTYVDMDSGQGALTLDAVLSDAPESVDVCLRKVVDDSTNAPYQADGNACDTAPKNRFAISARLAPGAPGVSPDLTINKLRQANASRSKIVTGEVKLTDIGARVDALIADGKKLGVLIEGRDADGQLANVVGRADFSLRTYDSAVPQIRVFPFAVLEHGKEVDPSADPRNDDPPGTPNAGRNYVVVAGRDSRLQIRGSVPAIKRVGIDPAPCNPLDPRTPPVEGNDWPEGTAPTYQCVRANFASGRPFGFAVRQVTATPEGDDILDVEEGHVSSIPAAGEGGLDATLSSVPPDAKDAPSCGPVDEPPFVSASLPCRPELVSVRTHPEPGAAPMLEARVRSGNLATVTKLASTPVRDAVGSRLDYEVRPRDVVPEGVRVRTGKEVLPTRSTTDAPDEMATLSATRVSLRIPLARYIDIAAPQMYSCARKAPGGPCTETDPYDRSATSALDVFARIVSADDKPLGGPKCDGGPECYIGRLAVAAHDFDEDSDLVLTGAPPADAANGTSTQTPEQLVGPNDGDLGVPLPRHFDVRAQLRDQSVPNGDENNTALFLRADLRLNAPLSLALRVPRSASSLAPPSENRNHELVPSLGLIARNLPGVAAGDGGAGGPYAKPTSRLTVGVLGKPTAPTKTPPGFFNCYSADGYGIDIPAVLTSCLTLHMPKGANWTSVDLNAHPNGDEDPARVIQAVVDGRDRTDVELTGYKDIERTQPANFGSRSALRIAPISFGFRAGGGIGLFGLTVELMMSADVIAKASNEPASRLGLSYNIGQVAAASTGGAASVDTDLLTDLRVKVVGEVLFGLKRKTLVNTHTGFKPTDVGFRDCATGTNSGSVNGFSTSGLPGPKGITLEPSVQAAVLTGPLFFLLGTLPQVFCSLPRFQTDAGLAQPAPAPTFSEPGHPAGDHVVPIVNAPPPTPQVPAEPRDLTISAGAPTVLCGPVKVNDLVVEDGAVLRAGRAGTTVTQNVTGANELVACDGRLNISAHSVTVEAGGTIDANATVVAPGAGSPGAVGPGGGNGGAGAPAHGQGGGPAVPLTPDGIDATIGAPAYSPTGTPAAGAGGGLVNIVAESRINVRGAIHADGGDGGAGSGQCQPAGGGGSGGSVHLTANVISLASTGRITADGGSGGSQGNPGGGGGGGRVRLDRVTMLTPDYDGVQRTTTAGGAAGQPGSGCGDGAAGAEGDATVFSVQGDNLVRAAGVKLLNANDRYFVRGEAQVRVSGVQEGGGPLDVIVCRRFVDKDTADGFVSPQLNPSTSTPYWLVSGASCSTEHFALPSGFVGVEYSRVITLPAPSGGLADGYYGVYAFAAKPDPDNADTDCAQPPFTINISEGCRYQTALPDAAQVRFASDKTPPVLTQDLQMLSGKADGCPVAGAKCQSSSVGRARILPDDGFSGLQSVVCETQGTVQIVGQSGTTDDCSGEDVKLPFNGGGIYEVEVTATDKAGNEAKLPGTLRWLVDFAPPASPTISVSPADGANGWWRSKPAVTVQTGDLTGAGSSGFEPQPISLLVGDEESTCGDFVDAGQLSMQCSAQETAPLLPGEGTFTLDAYATDRAGNVSAHTTDPVTHDGAIEVRIDHTAPRSELALSPEQPDGLGNTYVTKPMIAFTATDNVGGSGVDLGAGDDGSGVYFRIDNGPVKRFDGNVDEVVPDGDHKVCWYAKDRAGNQEDATPEHCTAVVSVDSTPPQAFTHLTPGAPDGDNGWYVHAPSYDVNGIDGQDGSGLDGLFVSLDGAAYEPYVAAAMHSIGDGDHELCVYATDKAGNTGGTGGSRLPDCRQVRVDTAAPARVELALDPAIDDGSGGWFRTRPEVGFTLVDTAGGSGGEAFGGPARVTFRVDGGALRTWDPDDSANRLGDGTHAVCWTGYDIAGNSSAEQCRTAIRVDATRPVPQLTLNPAAPDGSNGYYRGTTNYALTASDAATGSGLDPADDAAAGIFVSRDGGPFARYDANDTQLGDSNREVCVFAVDVAGNVGGSGTDGRPSCRTLRVDSVAPPTVQTFLDPPQPDGSDGWYVTRPLLDFAQLDQNGGSGGDAAGSASPAGVRFSVDGGPYTAWRPDDDAANRLADGVHQVCARGVDIAGNGTNTGERCITVKVDSSAPTVTAPIVPAAPDGSGGFYVTTPRIDAAGADSPGGSGFARAEVDLDSAGWAPAPATIVLQPGVHEVRVRALDRAGNASDVVARTVRSDGADPTVQTGTFPPAPNARTWFRRGLEQSIAVADERGGSGADGSTWALDSAAAVLYAAPFAIGEGRHHLVARPRDKAGRVGAAAVTDPQVDLTPPVPLAVGQPATIILPTQTTSLGYDVSDALSAKVRVRIQIYDTFDNLVRELDVAGDAAGYTAKGPGSLSWNGSRSDATKVLPGLYHYRVLAIDEAGNAGQSSEGKPFVIALAAGDVPTLAALTVTLGN